LGIAWRLAQANCSVTVYDRAEAGHGASWAAAGMLAAAVETEPGEEELLTLTLESQRMWRSFARELEAASGISVEYRDEGTIVVALTRDDAEHLRHTYDFQKSLGLASRICAREARRQYSAREIIRSRTADSPKGSLKRFGAPESCSESTFRSEKWKSSEGASAPS
jgi:glycine oxidase